MQNLHLGLDRCLVSSLQAAHLTVNEVVILVSWLKMCRQVLIQLSHSCVQSAMLLYARAKGNQHRVSADMCIWREKHFGGKADTYQHVLLGSRVNRTADVV